MTIATLPTVFPDHPGADPRREGDDREVAEAGESLPDDARWAEDAEGVHEAPGRRQGMQATRCARLARLRAPCDPGRAFEITHSRCAAVDPFSAVRLASGAAFLIAAAGMDVRARRVPNSVWVLLGTLGLGLAVVDLATSPASAEYYVVLASTAALFYALFFGEPLFGEDGFHLRPLRIGLLGLAVAGLAGAAGNVVASGSTDLVPFLEFLTMPVMVLAYQGMYHVRLLHGGADAKALIALTVLVPTYPDLAPAIAPFVVDRRIDAAMRLWFPFSFVVLVNAMLLFLAIPLGYLLLNAVRGDLRFPMAFLGRRADLDDLPPHVWLMERIDDRGEHVVVLFPRRGRDRESELDRLRRAGIRRAWVQPQIPFMVPLLGGFLLAFLVGNLLLGFLSLLGPRG